MAGVKRTRSRIAGAGFATSAARVAGAEVRRSRARRRLTQASLASKVGISRSRLADVEAGRGAGLALETWLALAHVLDRYLRFEFVRDPLEEPADAGHLQIQQLVLRLGAGAGFDERRLEMPGRAGNRWTDVALVKRAERILLLTECVNSVGDLGQSFRSSDRKLADAVQVAVALGRDGSPFRVGLCWVVRDTARNRELIARYEELFKTRFGGSSVDWVRALTRGGVPPSEPGLVWCDLRATRLFAWRHRQR